MKSDKTPDITYADLEPLIKKKITVKIIQKNLKQQKQMNMFLENIQCHKISTVYIAEKI